MRTFPLTKAGKTFAFEIEHTYVSRRAVAKLLKQAEDVTDVRLRRRFGSSDDVRVDFNYLGSTYVVWEPFGDNSRYWIGPKEPGPRDPDIRCLEALFDGYQPWLLRSLVGDVLTLNLFKRLVRRR
ncbi:hypothetical protein L2Y96_05275 [Luteibacter aegosomaticola]|uniref:hypothetical protein n=1 Tax=Luteibacter aegosomaticola TaxID=2911538 RepID=UPI001FFA5A87|nr:hypothetical protein [Luteibacter aegosomaticola]UPG91191.1 hypothetical protein L2Y96_05275 [Luteibacter aegosomaticola]